MAEVALTKLSPVFLHPILTRIHGRPNSTNLTKLRCQIYANAQVVLSNRGGGQHGHINIIMSAASYLNHSGVVFIRPACLDNPPIHNAFASATQIDNTNKTYARAIAEFAQYNNVQEIMKNRSSLPWKKPTWASSRTLISDIPTWPRWSYYNISSTHMVSSKTKTLTLTKKR